MFKRNQFMVAILWVWALSLMGCREPTVVVAEFESNLVYSYVQSQEYELLMDSAVDQSETALVEMFGTPEEPKIPEIAQQDEELATLVSLENLMAASGPADMPGRGLYQKHCALCHGTSGDGRGKSAALLPVYPRDYRMGRYKFNGTERGVKPTKEDLAYLIKHGISGTSMVKIVPELSEQEIDALVDYVIYLSWRGEVERDLLFEAADSEEPDRIYNVSLRDSDDEKDQRSFEKSVELLEEFIEDVGNDWLEAEDKVQEAPARDPALVPDNVNELLAIAANPADSPVKDSIARGKALFQADRAACYKCHGKEGKGDGENNDYDDWAKDWAKPVGLDKPERHLPYIARGALPVRKVSPRNFEEGVFRGGSQPEKLYQRIALGIDGTPMPAAPLQPEEIWDLVNFVRSLATPPEEAEEASPQGASVASLQP